MGHVVHASPLPFSNKRIEAHAPAGSTIREIVDLICPTPVKQAGIAAIVQVNGHTILKKHWHKVRPKEGTVINVRIVPAGGKGKNPLATLLSIAVMIAAPYAAAAATGYAATSFGVTSLAGSMAVNIATRVAVSVVGYLLTSALAPPPKPQGGNLNNQSLSATQFIEGAQNSLTPFGVVPICLGTNRMVPPQAGRAYTETAGSNQYSRQLFCWGVGNAVAISDLKIGETAITEFDEVDVTHRLAGDLHLGTSIYPNDPTQDNYNILLQQVDGYTTRTTAANADEAVVDLTFPRGLVEISSSGKHKVYNVQLEIQYALNGVSPQVWSAPATGYLAISAFSEAVDPVTTTAETVTISSVDYHVGYRRDMVIIDKYSGLIAIEVGSAITHTTSGTVPALPPQPSNAFRLGSLLVLTKTRIDTGVTTTTIESFTDDRDVALYGVEFQNSSSFVPSFTGTTVDVTSGGLSTNGLIATASQTEALRISSRIVFPARGTYDIRVKRITADTSSDRKINSVYLTAIKSFTYQAPVTQTGLNGTAMRIKGTDQLNGLVSQFNAIVSSVIPDYDAQSGTWINRISSNPASLYRFVLQGAGNHRPLPDAKINLTDLISWHTYCAERGYTYNRVIDYETSVDDVLRDIAAAGSASPAIVDGKRTVVVDRVKTDIVQVVTPSNSWNYGGEMIYPEIPHGFRVTFRNAEKGYAQDERIVYDDGYTDANATIFETLELQSCTNGDLAYKIARRHLATVRLRPETHSFMMDVESLVALRGDRIKLAHDIPIIGVGDGRVKTVTMSGGSPNLVMSITIDDTITIPTMGDYYVRVRLKDGSLLYKQITTTVGETSTLTFTTPFERPTYNSPAIDLLTAGDLLYVVEAGGEVDLVITRIEPQDDLTARITALNYNPAIFDAETGAIPAWTTHITTPIEFRRPTAPVLLSSQSDESAMLLASDGSYLPRAIFTFQNPNDNLVELQAVVRLTGSTEFTTANILENSSDRMIITGLQDGSYYDIYFRYKRIGSNLLSLPLQLNNYLFVGASGVPADVTNFLLSVADTTAMFTWDANSEIDISHYYMKYSAAFSGVTWATAQDFQTTIYDNNLTVPFQGGTYLIKAVDFLGNESVNAAQYITYDASSLLNVVATIAEAPTFAGTKDNVTLDGSAIILADTDLTDGYYYFNTTLDLGDVFISSLSAEIVASGTFVNDVFDFVDVFAETDIFGAGGDNDVFAMTDIFDEDDVYGIGNTSWTTVLEFRTTLGDTGASPVTWSAWTTFTAGSQSFRGIQFRLKMTSLSQNISPRVTTLTVNVDMPDRIERGVGLTCDSVTFATVTYPDAYAASPSVNITLQNSATDDRIEFITKTASGFSFKVYNQTTAGYVTRVFDYISSGYGRVT